MTNKRKKMRHFRLGDSALRLTCGRVPFFFRLHCNFIAEWLQSPFIMLSGHKTRQYIFGVAVVLLALCLNFWFRKPSEINVESVLNSLTRLESAYLAFPQPGPGPLVIVGFGGCTDITVNAITFLESLGVNSKETTQHSNSQEKSPVELSSLEDVVKEFTEMFAAGAAAEYASFYNSFNMFHF